MPDYCFWFISNKFSNVHMHSPPPLKRRLICLQKIMFELERCSDVMIISARCSLLSVILMSALKSMGPGIIVLAAPHSAALHICEILRNVELKDFLSN